jgi:RimJ/RimL family protein N-acetyltransferase
MEPLDEKHAELDFEALMSCRARLREELQWGEWPPEDFTLELNRADLREHHDEFIRREAFAFTVLSPDRARCLGCIYLERCAEIDGAQLAFWVIDDAIDIEADLVTDVLQWAHRAWSIERILIPLREANTRGIAIARKCGFAAWDSVKDGPLSDHRCFLSESGSG